jgi:hypothetical protein
MGLSIRLNLFHQVTPEEVYAALGSFYRQREQALMDHGNLVSRCVLHEQARGWTLLPMYSKPFQGLRQLQLQISGKLHCLGFLLAVPKSVFWDHEFSRNGEALDQFVQYPAHLDWVFHQPARAHHRT